MDKLLMTFLYRITGNKLSQYLLDKTFRLNRMLMGIGTGAYPSQSGEKSALRYLKKKYEKEDYLVLFDVGANKGQFLSIILDVFKKTNFHVYSFEPSREAYKHLLKHFQSIPKITLEKIGLDNQINTATLYYDEPSSLYASIYPRDVSRLNVDFDQSEIISVTMIDKYCEENEINEIHCLKIDVEGNEMNVLRGASNMFSKNAVRSVLFEFGSTQLDSRTLFRDVYCFLNNYKMTNLYRILPSGYQLPIKNYDEKLELFFTTNYLALMH